MERSHLPLALAMQVRILFFAVLRDVAGSDERSMDLPEGATARSVWERLRKEYPRLAGWETPPLVAINHEYSDASAPLHAGDELAFIPPVSGG